MTHGNIVESWLWSKKYAIEFSRDCLCETTSHSVTSPPFIHFRPRETSDNFQFHARWPAASDLRGCWPAAIEAVETRALIKGGCDRCCHRNSMKNNSDKELIRYVNKSGSTLYDCSSRDYSCCSWSSEQQVENPRYPLPCDSLPCDPLPYDPLPCDPLPCDPLPCDPLPCDITFEPMPSEPLPCRSSHLPSAPSSQNGQLRPFHPRKHFLQPPAVIPPEPHDARGQPSHRPQWRGGHSCWQRLTASSAVLLLLTSWTSVEAIGRRRL